MSRKRQAKKEKRAELARQLGVDVNAVDDKQLALQSRARVSRFVATPIALRVVERPKGMRALLVGQVEPSVWLSVFLVDGHGVKHVGVQRWRFARTQKGQREVAIQEAPKLAQELRYERPAHFIVIAACTPAGTNAIEDALSDVELRVRSGEQMLALADGAFATDDWEQPREVRLHLANAPHETSAGLVCLRGVHKTSAPFALPFRMGSFGFLLETKLRV